MISDISLAEIETLADAQQMRQCRNEVRGFMTHSQGIITEKQQENWFLYTYLPANQRGELYGYVVRDEEEVPLGYGMISQRDQRYWVSGGLVESARGKRVGHFLFEQLTWLIHENLHAEEAWLDVFNDNERAMRLYKSIGYTAVESSRFLTVMVHTIDAEGRANV